MAKKICAGDRVKGSGSTRYGLSDAKKATMPKGKR